MERDKATKDLMNLIHDAVNQTLSLKAGMEVLRMKYPDDTYMIDHVSRQEKKISKLDMAIDNYYIAVKGEPRK